MATSQDWANYGSAAGQGGSALSSLINTIRPPQRQWAPGSRVEQHDKYTDGQRQVYDSLLPGIQNTLGNFFSLQDMENAPSMFAQQNSDFQQSVLSTVQEALKSVGAGQQGNALFGSGFQRQIGDAASSRWLQGFQQQQQAQQQQAAMALQTLLTTLFDNITVQPTQIGPKPRSGVLGKVFGKIF